MLPKSTWVCVLSRGPSERRRSQFTRKKVVRMDVMFERVAGLDIGKKSVTVCVRTPGAGGRRHSETRTFRTMTRSLEVMADWLVEQGVTLSAMESTSTYWKPVFYCLEERMECWLLNAGHMKAVPGRKTDLLTELPGPDSRVGVRLPIEVATFPAHDQRRGCVAGAVRVGGPAGRVARSDRGPVRALPAVSMAN